HCVGLVHRFLFSVFKVSEYKRPQVIQRSKKSLSIIGFCKFRYKALQIWICSDHKSSDGYLYFFALCCKIDTAVNDLTVQPEAVFIIPLARFKAGGLSIGDHEYLFI